MCEKSLTGAGVAGHFDIAALAAAAGRGGVDRTVGGRTLEPALVAEGAEVESCTVVPGGFTGSHAAGNAGGDAHPP